MESDTPWLDCADLLIQLHVLCERSRALREACRAQRDAARPLRSPWPHSAAPLPEELSPPQPILGPVPEKVPTAEPCDTAMEAVRVFEIALEACPLEWQVAIVKGLAARTLAKASQRMRPPPTVLSV